MENTQTVQIVYVTVLTLNCLTADTGTKAAEIHLIINAVGLIQPIYFRNALTSKSKSKDMLHWRRGFAFVSTGNERLWIYSWLRKIRFDQGRPLKNLLQFPLSSASRTASRLLSEIRILQSGLDHNSKSSLDPYKITSSQ